MRDEPLDSRNQPEVRQRVRVPATFLAGELPKSAEPSDEDKHRAALAVAQFGGSASDAKELLDMLGLLPVGCDTAGAA